MKHFNLKTFIILTIVSGLVLIPSFLSAFAEDEGSIGTSFIRVAFSNLFYVFRFPTHILFINYLTSAWLYFIGLGINCIFYGLIIERIIHFIKSIKSKTPTT